MAREEAKLNPNAVLKPDWGLAAGAAPWPRVSPQHGWYQMTLEVMQKAQARAEQERARAGQAEDRSLGDAADKRRLRALLDEWDGKV